LVDKPLGEAWFHCIRKQLARAKGLGWKNPGAITPEVHAQVREGAPCHIACDLTWHLKGNFRANLPSDSANTSY
jgi:hypothetical protein